MSNDTDTRVVAASYSSTGQSVANNTATTINLTTKIVDTHAAVSSNQFTVPVSGIYEISVNSGCDANVNTGKIVLTALKNAVQIGTATEFHASTTGPLYGSGTWIVSAVAGDLLTAQLSQTNGVTETASSTVTFRRMSGPATIAATETVRASYFMSATQSIVAASATNYMNFDSKEYDSHNAVTTNTAGSNGVWKFTAPISGAYSVKAYLAQITTTSTTAYQLFKNGSIYKTIGGLSSTTNPATVVTTDLFLNAGDFIFVNCTNSITMNGGTLASPGTSNICIFRIGN
jgi:hypothetical protein